MATHDSSTPGVTMDSEKGYTNTGASAAGPRRSEAKLKVVDFLLRFLTFASTLSAFVIMITDRQYIRPQYPISSAKRWAKYHYSDAFIWFVVANGVGFGYTLLSLLFSAFNHSPRITRIILLLDLLVAYIILSGASAATSIAYVGNNGLNATQWNPICDHYHRYCAHVFAALVTSFFGWLTLTLVIIVGLHRMH